MFEKNIKIIISIMLIFVLTVNGAYAVGSPSTEALTSVVASVGEDDIVIDIGKYSLAYQKGSGDKLYDYLYGEAGIKLVGVGSGDKFMDLGKYSIAYEKHGSTSAISETPSLLQEAIKNYMLFDGFNEEGKPILQPLIDDKIILQALNTTKDSVNLGEFEDVIFTVRYTGKDDNIYLLQQIENELVPYEVNGKKVELKDDGVQNNGDLLANDGIYSCPLQKVHPSVKRALFHKHIIKMGGKTKKI